MPESQGDRICSSSSRYMPGVFVFSMPFHCLPCHCVIRRCALASLLHTHAYLLHACASAHNAAPHSTPYSTHVRLVVAYSQPTLRATMHNAANGRRIASRRLRRRDAAPSPLFEILFSLHKRGHLVVLSCTYDVWDSTCSFRWVTVFIYLLL